MRPIINQAQLNHLSKLVWGCPFCKDETVRYDIVKHVFVCWNCCKLLSEEQGHKILDGFMSSKTPEEIRRYTTPD
jgi:ribosomal protein S27E